MIARILQTLRIMKSPQGHKQIARSTPRHHAIARKPGSRGTRGPQPRGTMRNDLGNGLARHVGFQVQEIQRRASAPHPPGAVHRACGGHRPASTARPQPRYRQHAAGRIRRHRAGSDTEPPSTAAALTAVTCGNVGVAGIRGSRLRSMCLWRQQDRRRLLPSG
jgi:hypothetical protein